MTTAPIVLVVRVWEVAPWEAAAMNVGATGALRGRPPDGARVAFFSEVAGRINS
jgi:hypothetical protein